MKARMWAEEIFYFLGAAVAALGLLEWFWPRSVLAYLNWDYLVAAWLAAGLTLLFWPPEE